jgi:hypothetical protein
MTDQTPEPPPQQSEADQPATPAHNAGPSVAECAEADRRWWNGEKAGD